MASIQYKSGIGGTRKDFPTPQFPSGQALAPRMSVTSTPGVTININGDINGLSSDNVSRSLKNELSTKMVI